MEKIKIKSIKKINNDSNRYDIQVKDNNNFFANGILVHNCQVLQDMLDEYKGTECYVTEKIDGSSITCYIKNGNFGVCSRNLDLANKDNYYWKTVEKMKVEDTMRSVRPRGDIALQGELIGPSIQGNKYNLTEYKIYWFNVYDIKRQCYYNPRDYLIVDCVPLEDKIILHNNIKERVEYSKGKSRLNEYTDTDREGIVIRPVEEIDNVYKMGRLSFKVINPDFLLKYGE